MEDLYYLRFLGKINVGGLSDYSLNLFLDEFDLNKLSLNKYLLGKLLVFGHRISSSKKYLEERNIHDFLIKFDSNIIIPSLEIISGFDSQNYILSCKNSHDLIRNPYYHIENPYYDSLNVHLDLNVEIIKRKNRLKLLRESLDVFN